MSSPCIHKSLSFECGCYVVHNNRTISCIYNQGELRQCQGRDVDSPPKASDLDDSRSDRQGQIDMIRKAVHDD
jgi:hypothetical protein